MSEQWVDAIYEASGLLVGPEQGRAIGAMIEARVAEARRDALADAAWAARNLWAKGGLGCDIENAILTMMEADNE